MTVSSTTSKVKFVGNNSTTVFSFSYTVYAASDLVVTLTNSAGADTTLTEGTGATNYSVSVASFPGAGSITYPATGSTRLQANESLTIQRVIPLTQTIDLQNQGGYFPDVQEEGFDRGIYVSQQLKEEITRSIKISVSDTGVDTELPAASVRINRVLSFDAAGLPIVTQELGIWRGNWATGTGYVVRDIVKDTSNSNIYFCVSEHTSSGSQPIASNTDAAKWALIVDAAAAATSAQLADDWAVKTTGVVESSEYSSKAYAIGGTGVTTTSGKGSAKEWATTTGGAVDTSEYSAKAYALGGTGVTTTSGKGSAKEWATTTGGAVDTSEYSAKEYAIGTTVAAGSAKDWAQQAEDSAVTGSSFSALHHAAKSAASATASAASATTASTQASNASTSASTATTQAGTATTKAAESAASAVTAANEASALAPKYTFSTSTTIADPGAGVLRYNHGSVASVSEIAIDDTTADTGNPDIEAWILTWDDSTSTVKGVLRLVEPGTPANYAVFHVTGLTDGSGFVTLAVTHVDSNGTFGNGDSIRVTFDRNGDLGNTGATGSTGSTGPRGDQPGLRMTFDTATADADQGGGKVHLNNASASSATVLFVDDVEAGGASINSFVDSWDDSTNTALRGTVTITKTSAPENFHIFNVTGVVTSASTYSKVAVTHVLSSGTISNGETVNIQYVRTGNKGSDGTGSMTSFTMSDGSTTQAVSDGQVLTFAAGSGLTATVSATDTVTYTIGTGAITVGQDGTGHDVKFFGDTSGAYMHFDASTDDLILGGASKLGIGETVPLGLLHVKSADAGSATISADQDEALFEGSGNVGITLLGGDSNVMGLYFGDAADPDIGSVRYDNSSNAMKFYTNADVRFQITSTGGITQTSTAGGHIAFNSGAVDSDFRIASVNNTHMFALDAALNRVGIGTGSPSEVLHVYGTDGSDAEMILETSTASTGSRIHLRANNQTGSRYNTIGSQYGSTNVWRIGGDGVDNQIEFKVGSSLDTMMQVKTTNVTFNQNAVFSQDAQLLNGASLDIQTPSPTSDHQVTGLTAQMLAGGSISAFDCVCVHTTTGEVIKADASAYATARVIGIAPAAISDTATGKVLLQGFIRDDSWNWTTGSTLYLSETAGAMTHTPPSTDGAFVNVVGVALTPDVVYVNPSMDVIERA